VLLLIARGNPPTVSVNVPERGGECKDGLVIERLTATFPDPIKFAR
jgi:hypothetical protein